MTFFVEQVLQLEVGLVHVVSRLSSHVLVKAGGVVGGSVERLEPADEGHGADADRSGVIGEGARGDEFPEGVDDLVRRSHGQGEPAAGRGRPKRD